MASERPAVSVIVPAYDEAPHVREHLRRIAAAMEALARPFEVVLVDDGSRDGTAARAEEAAREDPRIRVERHGGNRGKGAALATGCRIARGDVLVFLDADLDISPAEIGPLLSRMEAGGASVAVGSKYAPGAVQRRPLHRVLLSRLYLLVTSILFRLPIRDTQTGLKAVRADLARALVPAIVAHRWTWDVELLLLAHRLGARFVAVPVHVDFHARGTRLLWRDAAAAGLDTLVAFLRDRGLGGYGRALRAARGGGPRPPRGPRAILCGDDLGLSPSVDRGLLEAAGLGRLTAVSALSDGPTSANAAAALAAHGNPADVGLHVDLAQGRLVRFLVRAVLGCVRPREVRSAVRAQAGRLRASGLVPTHVDAHRHAFFLPCVYRAVAAEARALGIPGLRRAVPAGSVRCGAGVAGLAKGALLWSFGLVTRGVPRAFALATSDGVVDAATAARWVERGRWPRSLARATVEVVAHPARGPDDVPAGERGIDRAADAARLEGLRAGLERLGVRVVRATDLAAPSGVEGRRRRAPREGPWTSHASSRT